MQLKLVIREGMRKDDEFTIKGEVSLGRSKGDLVLRDPKASSLHAKITLLPGGIFELEDLNSLNGTYVNGHRIHRIALKKGDMILIGKSLLEVLEAGTQSYFDVGSWQETIDKALAEAEHFLEKIPAQKPGFNLFKAPLCLEIVSGLNSGEQLYFAYGPRGVGPGFIETPLLSTDSSPEFFTVDADEDQNCILYSKNPELKINDAVVEKKLLAAGDRVCVGQIELLVKF